MKHFLFPQPVVCCRTKFGYAMQYTDRLTNLDYSTTNKVCWVTCGYQQIQLCKLQYIIILYYFSSEFHSVHLLDFSDTNNSKTLCSVITS